MHPATFDSLFGRELLHAFKPVQPQPKPLGKVFVVRLPEGARAQGLPLTIAVPAKSASEAKSKAKRTLKLDRLPVGTTCKEAV